MKKALFNMEKIIISSNDFFVGREISEISISESYLLF